MMNNQEDFRVSALLKSGAKKTSKTFVSGLKKVGSALSPTNLFSKKTIGKGALITAFGAGATGYLGKDAKQVTKGLTNTVSDIVQELTGSAAKVGKAGLGGISKSLGIDFNALKYVGFGFAIIVAFIFFLYIIRFVRSLIITKKSSPLNLSNDNINTSLVS